jgi:predicted deacylase
MTADAKIFRINGFKVPRGETRDLQLAISQSYSGDAVSLPIRVMRGPRRGPVVLLTAAVHGDELNGTGIIREIAIEPPFKLKNGTLILVPVVNILGFERKARYLPDGRDLNRCFPGSARGSLSSRVAYTVFHELVERSDYCIDLHTAAMHRTNFPNVRGDLSDPEVARLARGFGAALLIDHRGIKKSLRHTASKAGHPSIILEAGEVAKVEPAVVEQGVRGIRNVLIELGMIAGKRVAPAYEAVINKTVWLRSHAGGLLRFHAGPGDIVSKGAAIASCTSLLGEELGVIEAPRSGVILSVTTLPTVTPGDPVCHLGFPRGGVRRILKLLGKLPSESLHKRLKDDLGSSVVVEPFAEPEPGA